MADSFLLGRAWRPDSSDQVSTDVVLNEYVKVKAGGQISTTRSLKLNLFHILEHFHYLIEALKALPNPFAFHVVNILQTNVVM